MFLLKVGCKNVERLTECLRNVNLLQYRLALVLTDNSFPIIRRTKTQTPLFFLMPLANETSQVLKQQT